MKFNFFIKNNDDAFNYWNYSNFVFAKFICTYVCQSMEEPEN